MTTRDILMVPLSLLILFIVSTGGLFKSMDKLLNYSMKKKIKWGPFKHLYHDNRRDEYLHGPVLDDPNVGVYSPIFGLIVSLFSAFLISSIWSFVLILNKFTDSDVVAMTVTCYSLAFTTLLVALVLYYVFKGKYFKHRQENIRKIAAILQERDK